MNLTSFKYILISLIAVLFFVIVTQVLWLNALVNNSKKELFRVFSESMDNVSKKLQRDENIKMIRMNVDLSSKDSLQTFTWNDQIKSLNTKKDTHVFKSSDTFLIVNDRKVKVKKTEAFFKKYNSNSRINQIASVVTTSSKVTSKIKNIDSLVKDLVFDYENQNIPLKNRIYKKEIHEALKDELKNKGVNVGFEFAVFEKGEALNPIFQSDLYDKTSYVMKTELFRQDVYRNGGYLLAYPINTGFYIFNQLKRVFILSAFFSLIILFLFFITFKAILKQKKMSQIKNDFINNMTHEFKTPLATIHLACDSLRSPKIKTNNERYNQYLDVIKEENKKIQLYIDKILETALLDHNGIQINLQEHNLVELIQKIVDHFNLILQEKQGEIVIHSVLKDQKILLDINYFSLAISNVIDNAIKYCDHVPVIYISLEGKNNQTIIKIIDNGVGMTGAEQKRVFEKFYRVHTGDIHDVKGFGLGLSFVEQIVQLHGGSIKIESEKRKGTTVIISLSKHE